eukprot:COSAG02_NODE_684_length_18490_cov_14.283019_2_plen_87_part_00
MERRHGLPLGDGQRYGRHASRRTALCLVASHACLVAVTSVGEAGYAAQWEIFDNWAAEHLDQAQTEALAGRTAAKVFGFDQPMSKL